MPIFGIIFWGSIIYIIVTKKKTYNKKYNKKMKKLDDWTDAMYNVKGARGRHLKVYDNKCVITTIASMGSFVTGNASDGEKTIYYCDCIGVQFKQSGLQLGYLQLETASSTMNNRGSNFFNENTFTYDTTTVSNEEMEEIAYYVKKKVEEFKKGKNQSVMTTSSSADELKKYKELLDMGVISQEEFYKKKKQLLGL